MKLSFGRKTITTITQSISVNVYTKLTYYRINVYHLYYYLVTNTNFAWQDRSKYNVRIEQLRLARK